MKTTFACLSLLAVVIAAACLVGPRAARAQAPALATLELTGPYVYQNLAVFAVHDKNAAKHDDVLTLQEALAKPPGPRSRTCAPRSRARRPRRTCSSPPRTPSSRASPFTRTTWRS